MKKLKARFVARGDQQVQDVDFFEAYSPVVQLVLSMMLGLKTVQVDYTLAFVQAKAEPNIYIKMPKLFEVQGMVLLLKRNLYGLSQAPRNFYNHLRKGLEDRS